MTGPRLLFVRHGGTNPNAAGRYVSISDPDLSEHGHHQVAQLGRNLRDLDIDRVWSSPRTRCLRTADAIIGAQRQPPPRTVDDRLRELGFGDFEGMTAAELEAAGKLPLFHSWRQGVPPQYPNQAETFEEASERLGEVFATILDSGLDTVLVVGHSHALRILLACHVLRTEAEAHRRLRLDHARIVDVQWEGSAPRIVALNAMNVE